MDSLNNVLVIYINKLKDKDTERIIINNYSPIEIMNELINLGYTMKPLNKSNSYFSISFEFQQKNKKTIIMTIDVLNFSIILSHNAFKNKEE